MLFFPGFSVTCHDLMNPTDSKSTNCYHNILMRTRETASNVNRSRLVCLIRSASRLTPYQIGGYWQPEELEEGGRRDIFVLMSEEVISMG